MSVPFQKGKARAEGFQGRPAGDVPGPGPRQPHDGERPQVHGPLAGVGVWSRAIHLPVAVQGGYRIGLGRHEPWAGCEGISGRLLALLVGRASRDVVGVADVGLGVEQEDVEAPA